MNHLILISSLFFSVLIMGQHKIILTEDNLGNSFADVAVILEDANYEYEIQDILTKNNLKFEPCTKAVEHLKFTSSRHWLKFDIVNYTSSEDFVIDIARTVTNKVVLYELQYDTIREVFQSGDTYELEERSTGSINNLFSLHINKTGVKSYVLMLESDGENIRLPIIINTPTEYFYAKQKQNLFFGAYYGILIIISLLYFFYYLGLKDQSFIRYSIYVLSVLMLQFTLDGFTYYFLVNKVVFLEQYMVVLFASLASISFLIYVKEFLKLKMFYPKINAFYLLSIVVFFLIIIFDFIPGKLHQISYPLVNAFSLVSLLLVFWSVLYIRYKQYVSFHFTIAIVCLTISAGLFILSISKIIENDFIFNYALKIGSAIEVLFLSFAMSNKLRDLQVEKEEAQAISLKRLAEKNKLIDEQKILLETQVKDRTYELEIQKEQVLAKNKEVIDSINYAKRLQNAIIPPIETVRRICPDSFVYFQPKDIVSGDFYWIAKKSCASTCSTSVDKVIFSVADCTGHGVPGAFMSIIGLNVFDQVVNNCELNNPAEVLDHLNKEVYETVNKHAVDDAHIRDGMDVALCAYDQQSLMMQFSGAKNPIYIVRNQKLIELKGDKQPIGYSENVAPFKLQTFQLEKGDMVYVATDGFADQFGGPKGKKFKYKAFKELLVRISKKGMDKQKNILEETLNNWMGGLEQLDDICVVGIRI